LERWRATRAGPTRPRDRTVRPARILFLRNHNSRYIESNYTAIIGSGGPGRADHQARHRAERPGKGWTVFARARPRASARACRNDDTAFSRRFSTDRRPIAPRPRTRVRSRARKAPTRVPFYAIAPLQHGTSGHVPPATTPAQPRLTPVTKPPTLERPRGRPTLVTSVTSSLGRFHLLSAFPRSPSPMQLVSSIRRFNKNLLTFPTPRIRTPASPATRVAFPSGVKLPLENTARDSPASAGESEFPLPCSSDARNASTNADVAKISTGPAELLRSRARPATGLYLGEISLSSRRRLQFRCRSQSGDDNAKNWTRRRSRTRRPVTVEL